MRAGFGVGLGLVALVAGCDLRDRYVASSPSVWVQSGGVTGLEAVPAVGSAPHTSWVRAVNGFGAAIATTEGSVTLNGVATPLLFDGVGYANLSFDTPGVVQIGGVDAPVAVFTHRTDFVPPGLAPVAMAPVQVEQFAARVSGGSVGVVDGEVWWSDDHGHSAHRVLATGSPILGLKVVHADVDELLDVVVWTSDTVFLLRARVGGGMAWGGALQAPGYTVGGVGMGDLSGDNIPDVAVGWAGGGGGLVEVWHGDGVFGFERAEPRELSVQPASLLVADSTGEGQPQITLLFTDGTWERYIEGAPGRLMPIGPATPQLISPAPGWVLEKSLDLDGDGLHEIPASSPYNPNGVRDMEIYDLGDGVLSALAVSDEPSPWYGVGDGDGDLIEDIWFHRSDGAVEILHYELQNGPGYPRTRALPTTPGPGPIDIDDIDGDGHNDVWIASPRVWWATRGRGILFDPSRFWEPNPPDDTFVREEIVGPFRFDELDADPTSLELIAGHLEGSQLELSVMQWFFDDVRANRVAKALLAGSTLVDLQVCDGTAYALSDNALHAVPITNLIPSVTNQVTVSDARDLVCGDGPAGAKVSVAAGGEVISFNGNLGEVDRQAVAAYGLAYGDLDGTGVQVLTCTTVDCAVQPWTLGSGSTGLLVLDPTSARWVDAAGTVTTLPGMGDSVQLIDLDGDGVVEAVSHDVATGVVGIFRQVAGRVVPPYLWQAASPWEGGVGLVDADLDGVIDLWGTDGTGDLRYMHPKRDAPQATDSGDTGTDTGTGAQSGSTGHTATTTGDTAAHTGDTGSTTGTN